MDSKLVFDVGLHKGEDSEFYLKKGFRVVGVEADPGLCEIARSRLSKYLKSGQLRIVNAAIVDKAGPVEFYRNIGNSVWGTISPEWAARNKALGTESVQITVDGIEFRQLLEEYGCPYYLKIDIEGADLLCLHALANFDEKPTHISIESNKVRWDELLNEIQLLKSLGYTKFKVVDQRQVPDQEPPSPAREGDFVEHHFEFGSSGLFGNEAPGNWLSDYEAIRAYRGIFWQYRLFGDAGKLVPLRKVLARLPLLRRLTKFMNATWYDTHATI